MKAEAPVLLIAEDTLSLIVAASQYPANHHYVALYSVETNFRNGKPIDHMKLRHAHIQCVGHKYVASLMKNLGRAMVHYGQLHRLRKRRRCCGCGRSKWKPDTLT